MSQRTRKDRELERDTSCSKYGKLKPHPPKKDRGSVRVKESPSVSIISKKVADLWLNKIIQKEYSVTVHPQYGDFPERLLRTLKDREEWDCSIKENKIVITSNDPLKLVSLMAYLKNKGYFVEEC